MSPLIIENASTGCMVANPASGQLTRENDIFPVPVRAFPSSPFVLESLVSRDGFGPLILHTQGLNLEALLAAPTNQIRPGSY